MDVIEHYKKKLLRHIEDPDTVLYCLKKLDAVPVTIEILQDSEVGKVVNRLKKRNDTTPDVITSSKALVEKWKELVKNADEADDAQKPQKVSVKEVKILPICLIFAIIHHVITLVYQTNLFFPNPPKRHQKNLGGNLGAPSLLGCTTFIW
jgi:hypothetical protein